MGSKWQRAKRRDPFWRLAKKEGYRARSAFKLLEIDDTYRILGPGRTIVDLGAAPGGWSQVAAERSPGGRVVGIDLQTMFPLEGAEFLRGDFTHAATMERLRALAPHVDTVLSDMSPNISGAYDADHARSVHLAGQALDFAEQVLRPGGDFVCKVFEGELFKPFLDRVRAEFAWVKVTHPEASRKASSEVFVIGKRYKGRSAPEPRGEPTPQDLAGRFELNL
ncbi:MAG: RlmE family RNA methyltransferase [Halobacteriales archaeon]|nr:RlmE family RNA methyltransferase [Halobacteriales archaeon]